MKVTKLQIVVFIEPNEFPDYLPALLSSDQEFSLTLVTKQPNLTLKYPMSVMNVSFSRLLAQTFPQQISAHGESESKVFGEMQTLASTSDLSTIYFIHPKNPDRFFDDKNLLDLKTLLLKRGNLRLIPLSTAVNQGVTSPQLLLRKYKSIFDEVGKRCKSK